jgi:Tfp pilus assembly protein PilZ
MNVVFGQKVLARLLLLLAWQEPVMELTDRRQSHRVEFEEPPRAVIPALGVACQLLDVSFGGFLIESVVPFSLGEEHEFFVTTVDKRHSATIKARAVYCHRRSASEASATYASGFGFLEPDDPATRQVVLSLAESLGSATPRPTTLSEFVQFWQSAT